MADRLKNKVAVVFGAGCTQAGVSNGAAAAIAYAREGAKVVIVDVETGAARRTVEMILEEGGNAADFTADVTSRTQVQAAIDGAMATFGRLDILHNNVGINKPGGPVEMDEAVWDAVMATNIKSLFLTCKAAIPAMQKGGGGSIVNISSITSIAWHGRPTIAYSSSKAAVNHFTRVLAAQYGPDNIRCNAIVAGTIDTPRASSQLQRVIRADAAEIRNRRSEAVPLRRLGTPWELANAAVFLASDEASYVSGVVMAVDGGLTCTMSH
ncbi:SDR family NAD(P)-dependent oxidoreductase [Variovorax saccharolyticus]|uniref:SDR family NAD(P)-dependent oxidoreductase n=1 Tax=Variovorax saccharolyticus TaxID=3053516 RepID=UPI002576CB0F|nr:SDR family oxidoreductase [Variovorax sp. J22R187]MDM0022236.1 SDR family oxidoreductase [Variovorax sp. J22R187]